MELSVEQEQAYFADAMGDLMGGNYGAASDYSTKPSLSTGSGDSAAVTELQNLLILANGPSAVGSHGADGDFRTDTKNAVMLFQSQTGLPMTGTVNTATWAMLYENTGQTSDSGTGKGAKTLSTIGGILEGLVKGLAPAFAPKQTYGPTAPAGTVIIPPAPQVEEKKGFPWLWVGLGAVVLIGGAGGVYLLTRKG